MAVRQGQQNTFEPPIWKRIRRGESTLDTQTVYNITNNTYSDAGFVPFAYELTSADLEHFDDSYAAQFNYVLPLFFSVPSPGTFERMKLYTPNNISSNLLLTEEIHGLGVVKITNGSVFSIKTIMPGDDITIYKLLESIIRPPSNILVGLQVHEVIGTPNTVKYTIRPSVAGKGWHCNLGSYMYLNSSSVDSDGFTSSTLRCVTPANQLYINIG
jgi:hypothetical protein